LGLSPPLLNEDSSTAFEVNDTTGDLLSTHLRNGATVDLMINNLGLEFSCNLIVPMSQEYQCGSANVVGCVLFGRAAKPDVSPGISSQPTINLIYGWLEVEAK
jgi:hypothetical protein